MICTHHTKALLQPNWSHLTVVEIGWFLFVERLPDAFGREAFDSVEPLHCYKNFHRFFKYETIDHSAFFMHNKLSKPDVFPLKQTTKAFFVIIRKVTRCM